MASKRTLDDDPISQLSFSIFRLNGFLLRNGDSITRPIGQSSARWQILGRVGFKPQTVAQIARDLGHARQSVQRIADALVREGFAAYKPNPADKRAQVLELTAKGRQALDDIYARYGAWVEHIKTKLDSAEISKLSAQLNKLAETLESDNFHKD